METELGTPIKVNVPNYEEWYEDDVDALTPPTSNERLFIKIMMGPTLILLLILVIVSAPIFTLVYLTMKLSWWINEKLMQ